jgi:hypothetical protein
MKDLTHAQRISLRRINEILLLESSRSKDPYAYVETGPHKPFNCRVIKALLKKGYIKLKEGTSNPRIAYPYMAIMVVTA